MKVSTGWLQAAAVYRDRRMLVILFMGFSSGLPFGLLGDPMSAWLREEGISLTTIGLFSLLSVPYSLKFCWAPLIDRLPIPILTGLLGKRRSWAIVTQIALILVVVGLGTTDPAADLGLTALFALMVAFWSASQDIVIDAYRIEILEEQEYGAGAGATMLGWRVGQLASAAGGLFLADQVDWSVVYMVMAALVFVGIGAVLFADEPITIISRETIVREQRVAGFLGRFPDLPEWLANSVTWFYGAVVCPLAEFMTRRHWLAILLFVLLYKFGDSLLSVMKTPFLLDLSFSKSEIAAVTKIFGFNAVIAGTLAGGILIARYGILPCLLAFGLLQGLSNLVFVVQAWAGHDLSVLAVTIAVENVTAGLGNAAFVAYLSSLCNTAYTATQYALLTSVMAFARTVLSSSAGWLAESLGWIDFFLLTTVAALPGLVLLIWLMRAAREAATAPGRA